MKKERVIKGVALLITLVFVVILGIGAVAIARLHSTEISLVRRQNNSTRAFYLAEAGIEMAIAQIKADSYNINISPIGTTYLGDGSYSVNFNQIGDIITITSTGTITNINIFRIVEQKVELGSVLAKYVVLVKMNGWTSGDNAIYGRPDPDHPEYPEGVSLDPEDRMKMYIMGDHYEARSNVHIYGDLFVEGDFYSEDSTYVHGDTYLGVKDDGSQGVFDGDGTITDGYSLAGGDLDDDNDLHPMRPDQYEVYPEIDTSYYSTHSDVPLSGNEYIEFVEDGDHTRVDVYEDASYSEVVDSYALPAAQGVVYTNGDIHVKGTVKGRVTVVASDDIFFEGDIIYANGTHYANQSDSTAFLAYDDMYFQPDSVEVSGMLYVQEGSMSENADNPQRLRIYGNRIMASQSSFSGYSDREYIYDPNIRKYPTPKLPVVPVRKEWQEK